MGEFYRPIKQQLTLRIAKEKIAALVGHEDESVTFGRYGKDFQPAVTRQVVESLKTEITILIPPLSDLQLSVAVLRGVT